MNKENSIKKLEQAKKDTTNPALKKDIEAKLKAMSNNKPVEK